MNTEIEAELWALDEIYTKRGHDISTWTEFNIQQFASSQALYKLHKFIYDNPGQIKKYISLVRLANLTKKQLLEMLPEAKKSSKRITLYRQVRANWEKENA
jgi:hypothetical protein